VCVWGYKGVCATHPVKEHRLLARCGRQRRRRRERRRRRRARIPWRRRRRPLDRGGTHLLRCGYRCGYRGGYSQTWLQMWLQMWLQTWLQMWLQMWLQGVAATRLRRKRTHPGGVHCLLKSDRGDEAVGQSHLAAGTCHIRKVALCGHLWEVVGSARRHGSTSPITSPSIQFVVIRRRGSRVIKCPRYKVPAILRQP
jgi:hypothetical protein